MAGKDKSLARSRPIDIIGKPEESAADTYGRLTQLATVISGTLDTFEEGIDIMVNERWATPLLMLPGMDKLMFVMGIVKDFEFLDKVEDWGKEPLFVYRFKCVLRDKHTNMIVAQGFGIAHSKEAGVGKQTTNNIFNQVHKIDAVARSRALRDALFSIAPIRRRFDVASDIEMTHPDVVDKPPETQQAAPDKPKGKATVDRPKDGAASQGKHSQPNTTSSETTSTRDEPPDKQKRNVPSDGGYPVEDGAGNFDGVFD